MTKMTTEVLDLTAAEAIPLRLERVLILAPHTDDAELGCGGAIARFVEAGMEVHIVAFSGCESSLPAGSDRDRLRREFLKATDVLGIPEQRKAVYSYPVRELTYHRQEVLEEMIKLRREFKPQIVFLPAGTDVHQDHQVVHQEGVRAFKEITVWGYELPWNHVTFSAQAFVKLEARHIDRKWQALQCYQSQLDLARSYFSLEFISGLARVRGTQIREQFAEAFEVIRIKC
ncbi:MAG TPA: PIG-L deacetylase family protein [Candidatus Acidoferrales bacterium]|nr:PIG-L deacetylase family protein [Candidatus Acidoferrales bacterium]